MPGFAYFEPILIFTLLNVTMALGLYITALSGQCRWRQPPSPGSAPTPRQF